MARVEASRSATIRGRHDAMQGSSRLEAICVDLPETYLDIVDSGPWDRPFLDEDEHWYSPFILFSVDEAATLQPPAGDYPELSGMFAIGGNGGGETYLVRTSDGTIWVVDLVDPKGSLQQVADSVEELLSILDEDASSA